MLFIIKERFINENIINTDFLNNFNNIIKNGPIF